MRQIVYALTGSESNPPILDRLVSRFVERVRDDVEDIVWSASFLSLPTGTELFERFSSLGPSGQAAYCLNPVVFDAVCEAKTNVSAGTLERLATLATPQVEAPSAEEEFALAETITVDIGSAYCATVNPTSPVFMSALEPLTPDERAVVARKLCAAMEEIDETAPAFSRLIRNYTRRIFVRKIDGQVPASEQVDTELGAIRLRNVHSDLYVHDQLVDDLIHESTHNLLGTFEYLYFPFNPNGFRAEHWVRPVSPWSMRPIQVLPFIHACFVYFAMFHYCELRLRSGLAQGDEILRLRKRQNRYASGFLMPGRTSTYVSSLAMTDPRVLQAIDWLEQIMLDHYAPSAPRNEAEDLADSARRAA